MHMLAEVIVTCKIVVVTVHCYYSNRAISVTTETEHCYYSNEAISALLLQQH